MLGRRIRATRATLSLALVAFACAKINFADCEKPPIPMESKLAGHFQAWRVVEIDDLLPEHRRLFNSKFGDACPGLVQLDFFGDGKTEFAFSLLSREAGSREGLLLLSREEEEGSWSVIEVDRGDWSPVPALWVEAGGSFEYRDIASEEGYLFAHDVLVLVGYESWGLVYGWKGEEIVSVQVSD